MRCLVLTALLLSSAGLSLAEPSLNDEPGPPIGIVPPNAILPIPPELTSTIRIPPHTATASSTPASPSDTELPKPAQPPSELSPPGDEVPSLSHPGPFVSTTTIEMTRVETATVETTKVQTVLATITETSAAAHTRGARECVRWCGYVEMYPSVLSHRRLMCWCQDHEDLEAAEAAAQTVANNSAAPSSKIPITLTLALAMLTVAVVGLPGPRDCIIVSPRSTITLTETADAETLTETATVDRTTIQELSGRTITETRAAEASTITKTVTAEHTYTTTKIRTLLAVKAFTVYVPTQPVPLPTQSVPPATRPLGHHDEDGDITPPDIKGWIFGTKELAAKIVHSLATHGEAAVDDGSLAGATLESLLDKGDRVAQFGFDTLRGLIRATLPGADDDEEDDDDDDE